MSRNFMDLSRALKSLADAFHIIKLKLDGLYDSAGALGNKFELIEEITLTEAVALIERTTEPDGTAYNFKHALIVISCPVHTTSQNGRIAVQDSSPVGYISGITNNAATRVSYCDIIANEGIIYAYSKTGVGDAGSIGNITGKNTFKIDDSIKSISIAAVTDTLPIDSVINIYAVRK